MTTTPGFSSAGLPGPEAALEAAHDRVTAIFAETRIKISALAEEATLQLLPCTACWGTGVVVDVFIDAEPDPCLECEGAGAFDVYGRPTSCR